MGCDEYVTRLFDALNARETDAGRDLVSRREIDARGGSRYSRREQVTPATTKLTTNPATDAAAERDS